MWQHCTSFGYADEFKLMDERREQFKKVVYNGDASYKN